MKQIFSLLLRGGVVLAAPMLAAGSAQAQGSQAPEHPCPYDSAHFSWRKPVPRNRLRDLRPDRPGVTESPFTVDAGHVQIETDGFRLINEPGAAQDDEGAGTPQRRNWHAAYTLVKFGLSRKTDLQAELPLFAMQAQRPLDEEEWERYRGFGDVALRLKHNFVGDDQKGPLAASVIGYVRLPTGAAQVGRGKVEYGVVLPVNLEVGDTYNLEAQLESDLNYDPDEAARYVRLMPSVALDRKFGEKLGLLVEGVFPWNTLEHRWRAQLNLAPTFNVTDNFQLDAGTHLALNGRTEREYFIGFTLRR